MTEKKNWPAVKLGEVLHKSKDWIEIDPVERYKEITVRLWGRGVALRGEIDGAEIAGSRRVQVRTGQFILSRIDARNGAFGLIPKELDGGVVTNDFPVYNADVKRLSLPYLEWMSKTRWFVATVKESSEGTTNRVRLKEDKFQQIEIPLPPVSEQRRIVARLDDLVGKVNQARQLRAEADEEVVAFLSSSVRNFFNPADTKLNWVPLAEAIVDIENGWSPACHAHPAEDECWGVLKVGAVSFGHFQEGQNKELPSTLAPKPQYEIKPGDFLMSRANTKELVGACAIVEKTRNKLLLCDKIFRFKFHQDGRMNPHFLNYALKSPFLRDQIERGATGTSPTMKNISKKKIMELSVPVPSAAKQKRIIAEIDGLRLRTTAISTLSAETIIELDALVPSLLDRAFKGEL